MAAHRPAWRVVARIGAREYRACVQHEPVLVGSSPECDFVLPDPTVSRRHARLVAGAHGLSIEDLGSRNGTCIDGVAGGGEATPGARVTLGEVELRIDALAEADAVRAHGSSVASPMRQGEPADATVVSAGLTRFCVRELGPLLDAVADGGIDAGYASRVVNALATAQPGAGFTLRQDGVSGIVARAGAAGALRARIVRDDWVLEVSTDAADAMPGLRTLAALALTVHAAARRVSGQLPAGAADSRAPATPRNEPSHPTANAALRETYWQAARVARSRLNVLLVGESGTGKELLARYLHESSGEPAERYLAMNCAALPTDLLDAELFGIEAGVATGVSARAGRFELAHGGTLFLDEIGDMSLDTQARILRVLQERVVYRVGSQRARPADVRIVSATNRDLDAMVRDGRFRLDLYHRIADWRAELPPLRARREDIANLASQFLAEALERRGIGSGGISQGTIDALVRYAWPGNVRELEREMQRVALFVEDGEVVVSAMLKPEILAAVDVADGEETLEARLAREERRIVADALAACGGQVAQAAERLGVSKATLYRRIAALGLGNATGAGRPD